MRRGRSPVGVLASGDLMSLTTDQLIVRGMMLVRECTAVREGRTRSLRELARVVVELRVRSVTVDGRADWTGRSVEYRQAVGRIYDEIPDADQVTIQNALRYHVGAVLREVAPAAELTALGLQATTPGERSRLARESLRQAARGNVPHLDRAGLLSALESADGDTLRAVAALAAELLAKTG